VQQGAVFRTNRSCPSIAIGRCRNSHEFRYRRKHHESGILHGKRKSKSGLDCLTPFDSESKAVNVVIETPKGCRNKFKFDESCGVFSLGSVLPAGSVFPYDFGYVPGTRGDDGDPADVLLLMDVPAFPGCRVQSRLIGVIEAEQTGKDGTERNDRLVAVAVEAHDYRDLKSLKDMNSNLLAELEHFFESYNEIRGKKFKLLGHRGPGRAEKLLRAGIRKARKKA
jgi:inorganic pyrophosphatase